jgi:hypothetical protein
VPPLTVDIKTDLKSIEFMIDQINTQAERLVLNLRQSAQEIMFEAVREDENPESILIVNTPEGIEIVSKRPISSMIERQAQFFYDTVSEKDTTMPGYLEDIQIG